MIEYVVRDGAGWVTIDNPARRNALSVAMMGALEAAVRDLDEDPEARSIVLEGAGETFCAGADISEFAGHHDSADGRRAFNDALSGLFGSLSGLRTPLIAVIRGHCLGAGMALALSADLRIAAEGSSFAIPAARLGVGYPVALAETLVHVVGPAHAADLLLTARTFSGGEALAAGFVNRLLPGDELESDVRRTVEAIAANAPLSVRAAKASIKATAHPELAARARELVDACADSADEREGQLAFMERRPPIFHGR
ncbi:enoyl-CoA hydratase-related protein [Paractinoplanes atraurantiacus]|uniref:Enoyl-CoA hydratase/carnithine racemase n=1 Tax=Paractinoplanes atraurantiacus TaxID=1036182 RepID=A0A285GY24_9ACTN|nr:enoyl-CoA hydratase-related protein [Actinoplanes atraurantiacus]SNY28368.1 Enoyl-CoA hydratase/carnithine racemase [Actinoplanes atraurantiacus]